MKICIPTGLKQWYDLEVIVSRSADGVVRVQKSGSEGFAEHAEKLPGTTLTADQKKDLFLLASHPSKAKIGPSGDLVVPTYLDEWFRPEGELRFRGNNEQILIDRSTCLCADSRCRKCLQVNCQDQHCPIHTVQEKTRFRKESPMVSYEETAVPEAEERVNRAFDVLFDAVDEKIRKDKDHS